MRRLVVASVAFVLMQLALPSPAYALKWLAWFEELSGPGPYRGTGLTADLGCIASRPNPKEDFALLAYTYTALKGGDPVQAFERLVAAIDQEKGPSNDQKLVQFLDRVRPPPPAGRPTIAGAVPLDSLGIEPLIQRDTLLDGAFWIEYEKNQSRFSRCRVDRSNNIFSVNVELGEVHDGLKNRRSPDQQYAGTTKLVSMAVVAYFPVGRLGQLASVIGGLVRGQRPTLGDVPPFGRAVEIGVGAGAYGLTGTTLTNNDLWRGIIPFRVRVLPGEAIWQLVDAHKRKSGGRSRGLDTSYPPERKAARWRRVVQAVEYRYGQDLVIGTIDDALYGPDGPRTSDEPNEWIESHALTLNLGMVYRAVFKR